MSTTNDEHAHIDMLYTAVENFLLAQHCSMYGRAFNIHSTDTRREAVEWIMKVIDGVQDSYDEVVAKTYLDAV